MAISVQSGGASSKVPSTLAEINVTPLVDVMLVLLIIFMVAAPMMQQGIQVDLPKASAGTMNDVPDQLVLAINHGRQILINGNSIEVGTLKSRLEAISSVKPDVQVFIQADQSIPYGFVAQVMAEAKKAKITRVGLVTEPGDPNQKL